MSIFFIPSMMCVYSWSVTLVSAKLFNHLAWYSGHKMAFRPRINDLFCVQIVLKMQLFFFYSVSDVS